jgi:propanediol dehydratase small subunit
VTQAPADGLRDLVAAMVRDVVSEMAASSAQGLGAAPAAPTPPVSPHPETDVSGRRRTEAVRIDNDSDLDAFVRHLLKLFENPKNRQDVRAGRHTFRLIPQSTATTPLGAESTLSACRVERGAVTERQIKSIAESRQRLVLGRAAMLTPLARERARALGVPIEKEH